MSGDVFGNGMLLSKKIRLLAAFDHRDIFIDPDPNPSQSWDERKRLFDLPRSSWRDYNRALISEGGGVFSRADKSIPLSPQMKALTGLADASVAPTELIAALLKAECELLWFGGIGTYVKSRSESHADAGDKANDALRANAWDLRARVIAEGANLGVTQAARIEFSRKGGKINTDAVDNSAGVDTSDHEVNIKILLAEAMRTGALAKERREPLLAEMTDDVGRLVLAHNYKQTLALSLAEASARPDLDSAERFMERLERAGRLSRTVEGLPSAEEVRALRDNRLGLTRPELAKLVAYAKIDVFDSIVASTLPDDAHFEATLQDYFPPQLGDFADCMARHRLRREIIATRVADDLVNRGGPTFLDRVRETARAEAATIVRAFEIARCVFRFEELAARINALDNQAPAALQLQLHQEMGRALARATIYLVRREGAGTRSVEEAIAFYRPALDAQSKTIWTDMTEQERSRAEVRAQTFEADGAPRDLACEVAALSPLVAALDVADLADQSRWPVGATAKVFREVGATFAFDRLRGAAGAFTLDQHWDRLALRRTLEELYEDQRLLASSAIRSVDVAPDALSGDDARSLVAAWAESNGARVRTALETIAELEATGPWTFAKAILAAAELRGAATALGM
jgi:glutamate dehydrogenase